MKKLLIMLVSLSYLINCSVFSNIVEVRAMDLEIDTITYEDFKKQKIQADDIIYIGDVQCKDCDVFNPRLKIFLEQNPNYRSRIKYLDRALLTDQELNELKTSLDVPYIPTLITYDANNQRDKIEWTPEDGLDFLLVKDWLNKKIETRKEEVDAYSIQKG